MSRKSHRHGAQPRHRDAGAAARPDDVVVSTVKEIGTVRRRFPVDGAGGEPLRIALRGGAYADIVAHAKASLDEEVCGVVVGEFCEDEHGVWVDGRGAIRGTSSRQGSTHVTYTQETWQRIHEVKDREYPGLVIVGWYHTHPGFGVAFSEMDKFIQRNFFQGTGQFALVQDPLGGEEAICVNAPEGLRDVGRFWVDGRPRTCWTPVAAEPAGVSGGVPRDLERRLTAIQDQVSQLLGAIHRDGERRQRFQSLVGILGGGCLAVFMLVQVLRLFTPPRAPDTVQWIPAPVVLDGKTVQLGIELKKWQLPPEMDAYLREVARQRLALEEEEKRAPAQPETDRGAADPGGKAWMTTAALVAGCGVLVVVLLVTAARLTVRGIRRGARQRN